MYCLEKAGSDTQGKKLEMLSNIWMGPEYKIITPDNSGYKASRTTSISICLKTPKTDEIILINVCATENLTLVKVLF